MRGGASEDDTTPNLAGDGEWRGATDPRPED